MGQSILYKTVYNRKDTEEVDADVVIQAPEVIYELLGLVDFKEKLEEIKNIKDKEERNLAKRNYLPAVDVSPENLLTIDIDGISDKPDLKLKIIDKTKGLSTCYALMESVSGNLVAYFKYNCESKNYKYLYYKIYLELTLLLGVDIDYLPEKNRLRYVSLGELYHFNPTAEYLTDILKVDNIPHDKRGTVVKVKGTDGNGKSRFRAVHKSN